MQYKNISMNFECVRGCWDRFGIVKGHACKLVSVSENDNGNVVGITIERSDGATISLQLQTGALLSDPIVRLCDYNGQSLLLRKVMRKPWLIEQMLNSHINADDVLASVTSIVSR